MLYIFSLHPVRCKIVVDNKLLQQIKKFKYLGYEISYENEIIFNKNHHSFLKYWEF